MHYVTVGATAPSKKYHIIGYGSGRNTDDDSNIEMTDAHCNKTEQPGASKSTDHQVNTCGKSGSQQEGLLTTEQPGVNKPTDTYDTSYYG